MAANNSASDGVSGKMVIDGIELDVEAELAAAVEAERTQKPVRARKRKGEPTLPVSALQPDPPAAPSEAPVTVPATPQAAQAAPVAPPAPQAAPVAPPAPQAAPVAPPAPPAVQQAAAEPPPQTYLPSARELAIQLTRALRRPDGYELPREERQRRLTVPGKAQVLAPGDLARFAMALPEDLVGAFQLLTLDFPSFGASKLLVLDVALDNASVWRPEQSSVSAELFAPPSNLRQNRTPFMVLAAGSEVRLVVRNVSPGPVPVHPSITVAALEARG